MKDIFDVSGWGLRTKLILLGLTTVTITCGVLGWISIASLFRSSEFVAVREAQGISQKVAAQIDSEIEIGFAAIRALSDQFSSVDPEKEMTLPRELLIAMLEKVMRRFPMFVGIYTIWEPERFDGRDSDFRSRLGHAESGRLEISWVRDASGSPIFEEESQADYEVPGDGDYYLIPRQTRKDQFMEPYLYPVLGNDVLMTSIIAPVLIDGTFVGIFGADILIDFVQKTVDLAKESYPDGEFWIISHGGVVAGVSEHPEFVGKELAEVAPELFEIVSQKQKGSFFMERNSDGLVILCPISVAGTETPWTLVLRVPDSAILRDAYAATRNFLLACLVVAVAVSGGYYWFSFRLGSRLLRTARDLHTASQTVSSSCENISHASQSLSEGASEQAASLEETSASLEEISSMTKGSAEHAAEAKDCATQARKAAERGEENMQALNSAMSDLQESSGNISKIIKTIDEIAFQTNILALNAAVEAARAGEAGMGFAVVADEVRQLAMRSAQAAKETAERIDDSIRKSNAGMNYSLKVGENLGDILEQVRKLDGMIHGIANATKEQTQGIEHISKAVNQIDKITQANAEAASRTAAASTELQDLSAMLHQSVEDLVLFTSGRKS